jgi:hypothetical protein
MAFANQFLLFGADWLESSEVQHHRALKAVQAISLKHLNFQL